MLLHQEPQQPLVSVIIPTYNRPEYLKQAIASAIKQTYQNIEIIISDN
ncbi:MAG: glycosyltransferase family 2 protein, partial [Nostoc sp.]